MELWKKINGTADGWRYALPQRACIQKTDFH
jgi:hypothetical protein